MANKGPDGFLEAQKECYRLLEDKHYHSFLTSDSYHQLIVESKKLDISFGRDKSRESSAITSKRRRVEAEVQTMSKSRTRPKQWARPKPASMRSLLILFDEFQKI